MRNAKRFAAIFGAVALGVAASGTAVLYANDDTNLQIAQEAEAASEADNGTESTDSSSTDLPSGDIAKTDLTSISDEEIAKSGVAEVAANVMPALVSITNTSVTEVQDWFRGMSYQVPSESLGTGVIMGENDNELLIVTNNHVVEGAQELTVSFIDEESVAATIKGTDANNDLAVVAVNLEDIPADTMEQIRVAQAADSDDVVVGEQVVAIGNALGYGQSVTVGYVSALNRTIQIQDNYQVSTYDDLIQTDAAINEGNSGGALLNLKGEVIGINSAKASSSGVEGMGYAIPTSKALPIIQRLMNRETRSKVSDEEASYLGIYGTDVTSQAQQLYGMPSGVYVSELPDGSPAADAGMKAGMIIVAFDGETVSGMSDLSDVMDYYKAGETVTVTVSVPGSDGQYTEKDLSVTLGSKKDAQLN